MKNKYVTRERMFKRYNRLKYKEKLADTFWWVEYNNATHESYAWFSYIPITDTLLFWDAGWLVVTPPLKNEMLTVLFLVNEK